MMNVFSEMSTPWKVGMAVGAGIFTVSLVGGVATTMMDQSTPQIQTIPIGNIPNQDQGQQGQAAM